MFVVSLFAVAFVCVTWACAPQLPLPVVQQPVTSEKASRTPAQQKINSQLLYEIYRLRGEARQKGVPDGATAVAIDAKRRAFVDVRADVTPALEKKLTTLGAAIVSTSREYHSILAWVPLLALERIAADRAVRAIEPAAQAQTAK
jgi:hypothetical protein